MKQLFSLLCALALLCGHLAHAVDAQTTTCTVGEKKAASEVYSLNELLDQVPGIYTASIREAIATLVPDQKRDAIRFKPLLGGLSKAKLFRFDVQNKEYALRLSDANKAKEWI